MSKDGLKTKRKQIRKNERKKAKQRKILIISIISIFALVVFGFLLHSLVGKNEIAASETYSYHGQTVQLLENGTFIARLAHNVRKNGTFTKNTENNIVNVIFNTNGIIEIGWIINDALHIPEEWDDGHGHGNIFPRVTETYSYRNQTVQFFSNGTFTARLAHNAQKNGTYTKNAENNRINVIFNTNGVFEIGRIVNNALHIPREWDDGHGHGNVFPRINE
jgi:hypothetical protein